VRLFFWDPDEFLVITPSMLTILREKINSLSVINFKRKSIVCMNCNCSHQQQKQQQHLRNIEYLQTNITINKIPSSVNNISTANIKKQQQNQPQKQQSKHQLAGNDR
jgi:hypothetical protein